MKTLIVLPALVLTLSGCINIADVRCGPSFLVTLAQRVGRHDSDKPSQVVTCDKPEIHEIHDWRDLHDDATK
jgi:hypothetical protein